MIYIIVLLCYFQFSYEYGNLEPPQYFCLSLVDYIKVSGHYHLIWSTSLEVLFKFIQIKHVLLKNLLPQTSEACTFTLVFFRLILT